MEAGDISSSISISLNQPKKSMSYNTVTDIKSDDNII